MKPTVGTRAEAERQQSLSPATRALIRAAVRRAPRLTGEQVAVLGAMYRTTRTSAQQADSGQRAA